MTLKELKAAQSDSDPILVFVHGILSSADACWTNDFNMSWPELIKTDSSFPSCGIRTFSYASSAKGTRFSITDAADSLWERLRDAKLIGAGKLPLFVCHSMGGIVVRKMLVKRQRELSDARVTMIGMFLLASPSMGSRWATWLLPITGLMGHLQAVALSSREGNTWLRDLKKEFRNLCDEGRIKVFGKELVEEQPIFFHWVPWLPPVVRPSEGEVLFANSIMVGGTDHFTIAKPADLDALQHVLLRTFASDFRKRAAMYNAVIPAGATLAQSLYAAAKSLGLDIDTSALAANDGNAVSAVDRSICGASPEEVLQAVMAAFPLRDQSYGVSVQGTLARLSEQ